MVSFPNCKINLGLNIVNKRSDGYHDIETVFFPVHLRDALEVTEREKFEFSTSGFSIEGEPEKNLCTKAYDLLKKGFSTIANGSNAFTQSNTNGCRTWRWQR
jgi:4-diphosphocytidyl-2-C-methyl-D-erythritol kinase